MSAGTADTAPESDAPPKSKGPRRGVEAIAEKMKAQALEIFGGRKASADSDRQHFSPAVAKMRAVQEQQALDEAPPKFSRASRGRELTLEERVERVERRMEQLEAQSCAG